MDLYLNSTVLNLTLVILYRLTVCLDISVDFKVVLSKKYSNSVNFSDGKIFLKLR
jgi:hypothetical protein